MIEISNRIKELRKQKNITQKELAERLHVSQVAINYWENGKREPSISMLFDIAKALGVSYFELMTGIKENKNSIGSNIRLFREKMNLTQKELADLSGLTYENIKDYEECKKNASLDDLKKIAAALNINELELDNQIFYAYNDNNVYKTIIANNKIYDAKDEKINDDYIYCVGDIAVSDKNLLKEFHALNLDGKAEAIKRVSELKFVDKYTNPDFDPPFK